MMEVRSPTLQNTGTTRHADKMFGPEDRTPSVCTGLSLAIPAGENQGSFIGVEHLPSVSSPPASLPSTVSGYGNTSMPSLVGFGRNDTITLSSQGTVGGNENMAQVLPPDIGLSPRIPVVVVGNRTTPVRPWNASTEAALQNLGSSRAFDNSLPRDGVNDRPPVTAASDTKTRRLDIGNNQLNIATQLISQEDLNDVYNGGETQQVHNNEVGLDNTQLPFAGETQPVYDQEDFDDSVILQNDTLTASTLRLTIGDQSISFGVDAQPKQDSVKAPAFAPISSGGMEVLNQDGAGALVNSSAQKETKASTGETATSPVVTEPNERVLLPEVWTVTEHPKLQPGTTGEQLGLTEASKKEDSNKRTEVLTVTEHAEVQPAATGAQLGLTETSKKEGFNTPEPRGISHENVASPMDKKLHDREGKGEEGNLPKDGEAEKDVKDDVNGTAKVLSEEDIQTIKGRHVMKKFGRKNYEGEVVDYDAENQWFKVVYEDGDQEDLDLVEVKEILLIKKDLDLELKEILLSEETSAKNSGAKRKRSHREGGDQDQPRRSKMRRKDHTEMPNTKRRTSKKEKGTPRKKGSVRTNKSQPGKPPGSKLKGLKSTETDMKSSEMPESGLETKPKKKGPVRTKKSQPGKHPRSKSNGLKSTETDMTSSELPESSLETKPDEILNGSVYQSPVQSQTSGGKRKRISGVQAGTSIQDKKTSSKAKGAGKKRTGNAKTSTRSSAKKGGRKSTPKKSSAKRKGTRHGSLLKLPREESKVDKMLNVRAGKKQKDTVKLKGKRLKSDGSEDDVFTGKAVKKDFGGIFFSGVVTKYNQKTGYYKVKYEDGDQEDLEFDELKAVLVQ